MNAVALGGGGDVVVTGGYDQSVRAWDTRSQSFDAIQTVAPFKDSVTSVLLDAHVITAASVDGTMRAFDCRAGRCRTDTLGAPVTVLAPSGDGACVLAALAASRLRLLDRASGALLADYAAPGRHVNAGARCGAGLLAGDAHVAAASENGRVNFWELVDAAVVASLQAHAPGKTARAQPIGAEAHAQPAVHLFPCLLLSLLLTSSLPCGAGVRAGVPPARGRDAELRHRRAGEGVGRAAAGAAGG